MAYTKKGFINPQTKTVVINKVYADPIIIKYDYIVEEISTHYGDGLDGFLLWEYVEVQLNKLTKEKVLTVINNRDK